MASQEQLLYISTVMMGQMRLLCTPALVPSNLIDKRIISLNTLYISGNGSCELCLIIRLPIINPIGT